MRDTAVQMDLTLREAGQARTHVTDMSTLTAGIVKCCAGGGAGVHVLVQEAHTYGLQRYANEHYGSLRACASARVRAVGRGFQGA